MCFCYRRVRLAVSRVFCASIVNATLLSPIVAPPAALPACMHCYYCHYGGPFIRLEVLQWLHFGQYKVQIPMHQVDPPYKNHKIDYKLYGKVPCVPL